MTNEMQASACANVERDRALDWIDDALAKAERKFPDQTFRSAHEGFAVLKEEVDELWDEVRAGNRDAARKEAQQVGAMAAKFLRDIDRMEFN